jgi:succinyl-diaminopimelate desuccinylase
VAKEQEHLVVLASKLISFPSITPNSAGSIEFIQNLLSKEGFECFTKDFDVEDGSSNLVTNFYAQRGHKGLNICFVGHLDVVPPGNLSDWNHDPFGGIVVGDILFGRGAVDMKGAIASALAAFIEFKNSNQEARISFLLTTDEEGLGRGGIKKMLPWMSEKNLKIDFGIIGEPTYKTKLGEYLAVGRRGSVNFILTIWGKQGHVAYSESFQNPINLAIEVANELKTCQLDEGSKNFIASSLNITSFDVGNYTTNLVPSEVKIRFNVRFNDNFNETTIVEKIRSLIKIPLESFDLQYECGSLPFLTSDSDLIMQFVQSCEEVVAVKPQFITWGATSDARFLSKYCPCIEFGLQYVVAHQVNEHVPIADLKSLKNIYLQFLQKVHSI